MYLFFKALAFSLSLWLPLSWAAESGWLQQPQNQHAQVQFSADQPVNGELRLLLDVKLVEGWKTYWRSPGEGGIAPAIQWQTPVEHVEWGWPAPQRFDISWLSTQGYQGSTLFPITLRLPANTQRVQGVLTLSTCSTVWVLTDFPFDLDLNQPTPTGFDHAFTRALGSLPLHSGGVEQVEAGYRAGELRISARRAGGCQPVHGPVPRCATAGQGAPGPGPRWGTAGHAGAGADRKHCHGGLGVHHRHH